MSNTYPFLAKALDTLGKKVPQTVAKHPALTAGAMGVGLGMANQAPAAAQLDRNMMYEMTGAPGAKYSSCEEMNKFAAHHITLAAKVAFEKKADLTMEPLVEGVAKGVMGEGAKQSVGGIASLLGKGFEAIKEMFFLAPKREKLVQQITMSDPTVATQERENPGQAALAYNTMARFAPILSTDPQVATAFLRHTAMSGGALDHQMIRGLADAESAVQKVKEHGAYMRGGF